MPISPLRPCLEPGCKNLTKSGMCERHRQKDYFPGELNIPLPVFMVCGAPASGKSSYVKSNFADGDVVLDLDLLKSEITGKPIHAQHESDVLGLAIQLRNKTLKNLQYPTSQEKRLWFIVGASLTADRVRWKQVLKPKRTYILLCTLATCLMRIDADPGRQESAISQKEAVFRWFSEYEPLPDELIIHS